MSPCLPPVPSDKPGNLLRKSPSLSFLSLKPELGSSRDISDALLSSGRGPEFPRSARSNSSSNSYIHSFSSGGRKVSSAQTDHSNNNLPSPSVKRRKGKSNGAIPTTNPTYAFPSVDSVDERTSAGQSMPQPYTRTRSRTGPSKGPSRTYSPPNPQLRFSGSSSHYDTPPHTPTDNTSFKGYQVVVAAPVSGVETMDALVDGMNGGDDIFSIGMRSRARFGIPGHHPLYQPPLPTPPPGVMLGGGKIRNFSSIRSVADSIDEDDRCSTLTPILCHDQYRNPRPSSARKMFSNPTTVTPSLVCGVQRTLSSSHATHTRSLTSSTAGKPKAVVPSISDIIRTYALPVTQVRSIAPLRASSTCSHSDGNATVPDEPESEPEPLAADAEDEFLSRSSIDSIADEVQRTIRHQNTFNVTPPSIHPPRASYNRYSVRSNDSGNGSPGFDVNTEKASLYPSSMSHYQPSSPFAPSFVTLSRTTPSQAVAQYLRSARLTTLLKLTRSPHASQDHPLVVSLSDLGSPAGYPLVVFLGLGCVRHIMGLYDEMAECLGLRLVTIDR
jgi:hypothetical protein